MIKKITAVIIALCFGVLVAAAADAQTWRSFTTADGLAHNSVGPMLEDQDGNLWFGTEKGLSQFNGLFTTHLSGMRIDSLLESADSTIWAGTGRIGVLRYDGTAWDALTVLDGLPSDFVNALLEDRNGNLWFGTENGLSVYKPNYNPPLIEITNPQEQTVKTGKSSLFIEWRASDIETKSLLFQYKIDEEAWSKPTPANFMTTPPMNDGEHIFYVRAIDRDFNYSEPDTLTIIVDTIRPNVLIGSPTQGAIIGGTVKIMGGVTDSDLDEFQVEYAIGEAPSDGDFKLIRKSVHEVEFGSLAELNTQSLDETQYTIRVRATDKLGHTKDDTVTVTLDNTPPIAKLTAPQDGSRLTKQTEIIGEVSDKYLDGYVLEYTTDSNPNTALWRQIFKTPESLTETEISLNHPWEVPTITGTIFIRLTAIDAAGNTDMQMVSVEVPQALTKDKGGDASSSDGNARIYIPPRSLPGDTIITINRVSEQELQAYPDWKIAYDFEPYDLAFNQKPYKPATITLKYPSHLPEAGKTLAIYRFQKKEEDGIMMWVLAERLGGTFDSSNELSRPFKTITSATKRLGRFAVMQEKKPTLGEDAKIIQLTCQPRIFSPKGGGFDTRTAISFNLTKSARVTIKIYNRTGKLKQLLEENKEMPKGVNVVFWDGRDDEDNIVRSDLYIVTVTAEDATVVKTVAVSNR